MTMLAHPDLTLRRLTLGREQAPLLVIDNLVANADQLVELAAGKRFASDDTHYPGIRAKAPLSYQQFVLATLGGLSGEVFGLTGARLRFTSCHFSLSTVPPEKLYHLQCIPHIDSLLGTQLAFVHYLFKRELGGTAFYRHRQTGFEVITPAREAEYFQRVAQEKTGPDKPPRGYIDASTALYERIHAEAGVFNRLLVYRRNSLHSGSIAAPLAIDANPRTGRLTINGFLE
jgi:Family of unknown function (DUF6445)